MEDILEFILTLLFGDKVADLEHKISKKQNRFIRVTLWILLFVFTLFVIMFLIDLCGFYT